MKRIKLNEECLNCIINKYLNRYPKDAVYDDKIRYMQEVLKVLSDAAVETSAPVLVERIDRISEKIFNKRPDYLKEKSYFNELMLSVEDKISQKIKVSEDPLELALKYSMIGNYIDFGTPEDVNEEKLMQLLDTVVEIKINEKEFSALKKDLSEAGSLVYLTDNCGEIVLDKQLIKIMKEAYPDLKIETIVRGLPVLNDATLDDARQVGLDKVCRVFSNGVGIAGTCIDRVSYEARTKIEEADVILAKGQGNFETLCFCNKNVYYAFMCKCMLFAKRFDVPQFSGVFINDLRM